jgi:hypothetical protein
MRHTGGVLALLVAVADLVGIWRGESVCTQRPSACHDEHVVYHVAKAEGADAVTIDAGKIVDGNEVDMGTLSCTLDRAKADLRCPIPKGVFEFHIAGDDMAGTLRLTDGTLFRRIAVKRVRAGEVRGRL